jgi:hypothetical protein
MLYVKIDGVKVIKTHCDLPRQDMLFEEFLKRLNNCLTRGFRDNVYSRNFYLLFIESNYRITKSWYDNYGYDTPEEWAEEYFKNWDFDNNLTILKSKLKSKYNNVLPKLGNK